MTPSRFGRIDLRNHVTSSEVGVAAILTTDPPLCTN